MTFRTTKLVTLGMGSRHPNIVLTASNNKNWAFLNDRLGCLLALFGLRFNFFKRKCKRDKLALVLKKGIHGGYLRQWTSSEPSPQSSASSHFHGRGMHRWFAHVNCELAHRATKTRTLIALHHTPSSACLFFFCTTQGIKTLRLFSANGR